MLLISSAAVASTTRFFSRGSCIFIGFEERLEDGNGIPLKIVEDESIKAH